MLTKLTVVIILQYMQTPNHYVVHLKLIQCYVNYINTKGFILIVNLFYPCVVYLSYADMAKSKVSAGKIPPCHLTVLNIQVLKFYLYIKYCSIFLKHVI